jgi:hypothetical protein
MANYFVPNVGPSVYMTPEAAAWVERTGRKVEKKEFDDLEEAKRFALRILSRVEDAKGGPIWDPRAPAAAPTAPAGS